MRAVADRPASLDPDGKEIREYVSEEYMRQYVNPMGLYFTSELVQKPELSYNRN